MPGQGVQISARAPTKGFVQTGASARAPSLNGALALVVRILFSYSSIMVLLILFYFIIVETF